MGGTSARRHSAPGALADISRLAAAAVLLGVVAVVTVQSVQSATSKADSGRTEERKAEAALVAGSFGDWLRGGAQVLADGDSFRVDQSGRFVGAGGLTGPAAAHPCSDGRPVLQDVVDTSRSEPDSMGSLVIDPPGSCSPVIAFATSQNGTTVVVTHDLAELPASSGITSKLPAGVGLLFADRHGTALIPAVPRAQGGPTYVVDVTPQHLRALPASGTSFVTTHDADGTKVVEATAPADYGWSAVLEQDAASFDVGHAAGPSGRLIILLAVLFALVLALQAVSDARRRAVARHADAHAAAFLAVLSHELRTPLTVIKGFIDTLVGRWDALTDDQRHNLVDRLPSQSRRLNRVVDRLLLAANMQAGVSPAMALGSVKVADALERVASSYTAVAPLHEFVVDAGPDVAVRADVKAVDQILDQLVDNAVKYSPAGGTVRLSARRRRTRVEIAVEDEGVGLPRDTRAIFDAFTQGEDVDGRVHDEGGVGVGLYIVRTLCAQLHGSVHAERRARGARLVVTLRASEARLPARV
ncbi:MAG: HAMP domain-containing histidine kinase [Acidimicrobiia bacterium]|nr:HAMP domain-containing histidine kinase [Acidimicrobiia bacterium]